MNCKFKIESNEKVVFEDILDEKGEYNYKTSLNDLKVIVDAGSGHNVSKKIKLQEQKNEEKIVQTEKITKEIELLLEENRVLKNQINVLEASINPFLSVEKFVSKISFISFTPPIKMVEYPINSFKISCPFLP